MFQPCHRATQEVSDTTFQVHLPNECYRKLSLGADAQDPKPSKILRLEHTTAEYDRDPASPQQHDVDQQRSPHLGFRAGNASERALTAPSGTQWSIPVNEGAQLDTSGYVQQSSSFEQARNSVTVNQKLSYSPGYDRYDVNFMHSMDVLQPRSMLGTGQDSIATPWFLLTRVHAPNQEFYASSNISSFDQWSYSQPACSNNTEMT